MKSLHAAQTINRRHFLTSAGLALGGAAAGLLGASSQANASVPSNIQLPHIAPKAKRIIYLFQSGGPSQIELMDHKPMLDKMHNTELPAEVRMGQRLTGMTANQQRFPLARSIFNFSQHGESGQWWSELLPYTAKQADDICIVRTVHTEAINHDPAITFCQTGSQLAGRPSFGAWTAYGLGTMNENLPAFMVLVSRGTGRAAGQPLYDRLWGSGQLPSKYQGVKLRSAADPVLYLSNPGGCSGAARRQMLDQLRGLNEARFAVTGDPEIETRIEQYEMAYRMQASVPELTDISSEPQHVLDMYGPDVHTPGAYARNCLLARRMAERGVRFTQLYHMGWDQHNAMPDHLPKQCKDTDQPSAALVADLKQRGLLDDTLVVWGGEFGRTAYCQGPLSDTEYGRDHHPRCFSVWLAGGGIKPGLTYGATDDLSYNIVENPVHVSDLHATLLHCMGMDHEALSIRSQGLDIRLTGVEKRHIVPGLMS